VVEGQRRQRVEGKPARLRGVVATARGDLGGKALKVGDRNRPAARIAARRVVYAEQ
jgi:hypothetical protein